VEDACLVSPADTHALITCCSTTPVSWPGNPKAGIDSKGNNKNDIYFSVFWKLFVHPQKERKKFLPRCKITNSAKMGYRVKIAVPVLT
jgi:hypothetical protein